jgi:hypothetical protein
MHWITGLSLPVASPLKSRFAEYCDYCRIHIADSSLLVGLGIKVDGDPPGVGGNVGSPTFLTKRKTDTEARYIAWLTCDFK